jgi:hypothetical protein
VLYCLIACSYISFLEVCITVALSCQMTLFKNNYILQYVHFLIMNKIQLLHHSISAHFLSPSHLCMHVLKLTLILHLVVFTAATTLLQFCCNFFFPKEYRISFAASCIEYSLILVKLMCPNNIHTSDKKQKLIFHSMLSK